MKRCQLTLLRSKRKIPKWMAVNAKQLLITIDQYLYCRARSTTLAKLMLQLLLMLMLIKQEVQANCYKEKSQLTRTTTNKGSRILNINSIRTELIEESGS